MESRLTDLELAEIDLNALFIHDARGRIVRSNEPDGVLAPRFAFGRTRAGNAWRVGHQVPDAVARRLEELAASEPASDDLEAMPARLDEMIDLLGPWDAPVMPDRELSYRFPDEIPVAGVNGVARITYENLTLLRRMVPDLAWPRAGLDAGDICTAMVVEGAAVSMCFCARLTDRAAEAGVETLEAYRGQGYAPAVVAAWARAVRDSGRIPFYSTSHTNLASQAVARKLGLVRYAVSFGIE
jgi:RimJ/RimL family protein N-acetyltransferase